MVGILLSNRPFVSLLILAFAVLPPLAGSSTRAAAQSSAAQSAAQSAAPPLPKPVCGLEGEIGEGRGRIIARGPQGYRGEMTIPLARNPVVVLKVSSDFAPHRPAVDRITLEIGATDDATVPRRLSGDFGARVGRAVSVVRTAPPTAQDSAWFEALMSGATLTATEGEVSTSVTYSAGRFEDDYNYLLDLLQLVAGWEVADLCINRPAT